MDKTTIILLVLIGVAVLATGALYIRARRTRALRGRFGPEYSRAVDERGGQGQAEADLLTREKRVAAFDVRPLTPGARERFTTQWSNIQADFVDNPKQAVGSADALLGEVMSARGYPVSDFEQRSKDLSVDHPAVVQNYRAAHEITIREQTGEGGTEELRRAMIHYRFLFDELVATPVEVRSSSAA